MTTIPAVTKAQMLSDLAAKDPFFATPVASEQSRITGAFEWAAWEHCPHIVTVLHRQGSDADFNRRITQAMHTTMPLPPETLCFSGIITKRNGIGGSSVDWTDTRMKYGFNSATAALAFAAAVERDFGVQTMQHTLTDAGPDRRVFTPHGDGPRPGR